MEIRYFLPSSWLLQDSQNISYNDSHSFHGDKIQEKYFGLEHGNLRLHCQACLILVTWSFLITPERQPVGLRK